MKKIENKTFGEERALYNAKDTRLINVSFKGEEDGESALKESSNIYVEKSLFALRYPLWHVNKVDILKSEFAETCRAPLWYSNDILVVDSKLNGVKAFRECGNIVLKNSNFVSEEFMWRCHDIDVNKCYIEGQYGFFESKDIKIKNLKFKGKYSFQYVNNLVIEKSEFDTKDAFWHSKNVVVKDSIIKGEYLAWYAEDITFINCEIHSHQPLCYCKNLKLVNCKMIDCDLAFEYSNVDATIVGHINSIKNPLSGKIVVDSIGELIREDDKYQSKAVVTIKE